MDSEQEWIPVKGIESRILIDTPETRVGKVPWHHKKFMQQLENFKNSGNLIIKKWD